MTTILLPIESMAGALECVMYLFTMLAAALSFMMTRQ
jgi:hypothetical protein